MHDTLREKAAELGRLVAQTPEYQAVMRARDRADEDRELVARLNRLAELDESIVHTLQEGREPEPAVREAYEAALSEVQANAAYQALVAAQSNLDKVLHRVNEAIARGMEEGARSRIILPA